MNSRQVVFYLLLFAFFCLCVKSCLSQTICVTWPKGDSQEAVESRAEVNRWLVSKGHRVGCTEYDYELMFYPYSGAVDTGETYFVVQYARERNLVVGTIITNQPVSIVSGWMISLWPKGVWHSVYRDPQARTLEQGLRRVSKFLKKRNHL